MTELLPLRFSSLKRMGESPAHYRAALERPFRPTAAQRLGTAVHRLTFENAPINVFDGAARRGKAWDAFEAEHADDDSIITAPELATAKAMRDALWRDSDARRLLSKAPGVSIEETIRWSIGKRECQGTPDVASPRYVVDLKTTDNADPRKWTGRYGTIRKYSYHAQVDWYRYGASLTGGEQTEPEEGYLVAVESRWPHVVQVYRLDPSEFEAGRMLWRSWFETLRVCEESDFWPGYSQQIVTVCAPDDDGAMPDLVFGDEAEEAAE